MLTFNRLSQLCLYCLWFLCLVSNQSASALPLGFGYNQGAHVFSERTSEHFHLFHERSVPSEGAMTFNALEGARPAMEQWFGEKRTRPLPVIMSAASENASFANFVTDAIELQTLGQGSRDLAWHEYTHSTMYRTMDNWFGPAGSVLHLAWLPAWYLEGLAETFSVSVGSDVIAAMERYQALSGDWPSYDRLHSLYSQAGFFERGYATAGGLVAYLLKKGDAKRLPELQRDFFRYSMPWWWPWAVVPLNGFLPMDQALKNFVGLNGEELYASYKKAARAHWTAYSQAPFLLQDHAPSHKRKAFNSVGSLRSTAGSVTRLAMMDGQPTETQLLFDKTSGWAIGEKKLFSYPDGVNSYARAIRPVEQYSVQSEIINARGTRHDKIVRFNSRSGSDPNQLFSLTSRRGSVGTIYDFQELLAWFEQDQATTKLCYLAKKSEQQEKTPLKKTNAVKPRAECPLSVLQPRRLRPLGQRLTADGLTKEIWLKETEETLYGNRHQVLVIGYSQSDNPDKPDTHAKLRLVRRFAVISEPVAVAFAGPQIWLLSAERNDRPLRRIDETGACLSELRFKDYLLDVHGIADGSLILGLFAGRDRFILKLTTSMQHATACTPPTTHTSPLLVAMNQPGISLPDALAASDLWHSTTSATDIAALARINAAKPLDQEQVLPLSANSGQTTSVPAARPARWRGRAIAGFPWIGADDALGLQFGLLSVPLMDEMQNETVRATFLYGLESHFPYQEVALTSTRFWPTLSWSLYRQQTYNGRFFDQATRRALSSYLDEKGTRIEAVLDLHALGGQTLLGGGIKIANLKPYLGTPRVKHGNLIEPGATLSVIHKLGSVTLFNELAGRVAPNSLNKDFDYNELGGSTSLSFGLPLASKATLGLEGSRTRGQKQRDLKEMYTPLKTFVPGSGGGYNKNSYPLLGEQTGGLFAPRFGDTQARAKVNWTVPVIADVDKLVGILYMERLDFTAFYNYGSAWTGSRPPTSWRRLIRAHGYNLDLQLEDKGFRFNLGVGVGQVIGDAFESYATTGFDAIF